MIALIACWLAGLGTGWLLWRWPGRSARRRGRDATPGTSPRPGRDRRTGVDLGSTSPHRRAQFGREAVVLAGLSRISDGALYAAAEAALHASARVGDVDASRILYGLHHALGEILNARYQEWTLLVAEDLADVDAAAGDQP